MTHVRMSIAGMLSALLATAVHGAEISPAARALAEAVAAGAPGAACAVINDGRPTLITCAGVRKAGGSDEAITVDDRFHLGSCGKAFTATLAACLVEDKRLRWDSTPGDILPANEIPAPFATVTLTRLLTHAGGIPCDAADLAPQRWAAFFAPDADPMAQRIDLVRLLAQGTPLTSAPGQASYSNLGMVLAGRMLEVAGGARFEQLVRDRICTPLGITSLGWGAPGRRDPHQPWGHAPAPVDPQRVNADNPPGYAPAGTIHLTIGDWARFVRMHLLSETGPVLHDAASFAHLHRVGAGSDMACGWMPLERAWAGGTALTHSGCNTMFFAVAWLAPKRRFAALVCLNRGDGPMEAVADAVVGKLIAGYLPTP